ncbi:MAG: hypothetical protein WA324_29605 [Bryobacteraceae bacterium]
MASQNAPQSHKALALGLFFVAPLLAEFLLGNLPIKMLPALIVLAPLYGGGALLIREWARRCGRGWPTMVILAVVYAIVEEAFTTQSLFNPNYLKLNLHLLDPGYMPVLGIGAWWTLFVLTLHVAWSMSASIALVEALTPSAAAAPWLGKVGLTITTLLFIFGAVASTMIGYRQDHYLSAPSQLVCAAIICVILAMVAFRIPPLGAIVWRAVPSPWLAGGFTLLAASGVLLIPKNWGWWAAISVLVLDLSVLFAVLFWSRSTLWNMRHKLALASGAALAYAWHSFIQTPAIGGGAFPTRVGNAIFTAGAIALIAVAAMKNRDVVTSRPTPIIEAERS